MTVNIEAENIKAQSGDEIQTSDLKLKFNQGNQKDASASFTIIDKLYETVSTFDFALKYWPSYVNYRAWHTSGAYAFRTIDNLFYPQVYGAL